MSTCGSLHSSACSQELQASWRHCPLCGTLAGELAVKPPKRAQTPAGQPSTLSVYLDQTGPADVRVEAEVLEANIRGVELSGTAMAVKGNRSLGVVFPASEAGARLRATIRIRSNDGVRTQKDYWNRVAWKSSTVDVECEFAPKPTVELFPGMLIFSRNTPTRTLKVRNTGRLAIRIERLSIDPGYRIDPGPDSVSGMLEPNSQIEVNVTSTESLPGTSSVRVLGDGGELARADLVRMKGRPPRSVPRFVVGIDFGTSGTSILARDMSVDDTVYLGESERFPTVVYCPNSNEATWLYGTEAINQYSASGHQGNIVYELKSKLREPTGGIHDGAAHLDAKRLLSWYFGRLLKDHIRPYLEDRVGRDEVEVLSVFSIPVLDQGDLQEIQRSRTEEAALSAGFGDLGDITFALEPHCAALYLLQQIREGKIQVPLNEGDTIIVFDSGGGTTDIISGQVRFEQERPVLSITKSISGEIGEGLEFGGTIVTRAIGRFLARDPKNSVLDRGNMLEFGEQTGDSHGWYEEFDETGVGARPWDERFPTLKLLVEQAKVKLYPEDPSSTVDTVLIDDTKPYVPLNLARNSVDSIVDMALPGVLQNLSEVVDYEKEQNRHLAHLLAVGGNCNLTQVRREVKHQVRQTVEGLSNYDRFVSVPRGTVLIADRIRTVLPYEIEVTSGVLGKPLRFAASAVGAILTKQTQLELDSNDGVEFRVWARVDGRTAEIERFVAYNDTDVLQKVVIAFRIDRGYLYAESTMAKSTRLLCEHQL